jgi:hypothetical protein
MLTNKLSGDFSGSSVLKDDRKSGTPLSSGLQPEIKISEDVELKSLLENVKDCIKKRLLASTYHRVLKERNVSVDDLYVYLMPFPVDKRSDLLEYCYSIIMENFAFDSYENTIFVFRNSDKSMLLEVWPGTDLSTTSVYQETAKPGHFHFEEEGVQEAKERVLVFTIFDYWDLRLSWIGLELEGVTNSILDNDDTFSLSL